MAGRIATTIRTNAVGSTSFATKVPAMAREQANTRQGNAVQQHAADATAPTRSAPRSNGLTTLKAVAFGAGVTVTLSHRLGRAYIGWTSHSATGNIATLYAGTSPDATRFLVLTNPSANAFSCDVEVW